MTKRYFILGALLIIASFGLVLLPDSGEKDQVPPEVLLKELMSHSRYLSPDQVAARLINEDPSIFLVDVRDEQAYVAYSLPGAVNIPLSSLLNEQWKPYYEQKGVDLVFISNDHFYAEQAWVLCSRVGYKNMYVMEGGLNKWFKDIMQPVMPPPTDPVESFELYAFRKGAALYFGGGSDEPADGIKQAESITIIKRTKKTAAAGGC